MGEARRGDGARDPLPSRRRRPWRLALPLLLAPLLLLAFVDLRPGGDPVEARIHVALQGSGGLRVGAGKARIELPPGGVLAGYRPFGRKAEGASAPIHVRSLVLEAGGIRTGILLLELMTLPASLGERIAERARAQGIDCSLRIASHTHTGPGGYDRALLPQAVGVGRFDPAVEEAILSAVSASLAAARSELGPARIRFEEREVQLVRNRDRKGEPVDDRLGRMDFLRPDGRRVATVLRLAAHPTLAPLAGGRSGDWPGALMALLEQEGGVALVVQGAVGDARVRRKDSPEGFAGKVMEELALTRQGEAVAHGEAGTMGAHEVPAFAGTNKERTSSERAVGDAGDVPLVGLVRQVGNERDVPPVGSEWREAGEELPAVGLACAEGAIGLPPPDLRGVVPRPFTGLLSNAVLPLAPASAHIAGLRIGEHLFLGLPVEPTGRVGAMIEAEAGPKARVLSLAQDYAGYAVLEEDLDEGVLSARAAWFGAALTPALLRGAAALADAVQAPAPPRGEAAIAP